MKDGEPALLTGLLQGLGIPKPFWEPRMGAEARAWRGVKGALQQALGSLF